MATYQQLQDIDLYASLFFTIEEISLLISLDAEELRREVTHGYSDINKAYHRGKLRSQVELRQRTRDMAEKRDLLANAQMVQWLRDMDESELR